MALPSNQAHYEYYELDTAFIAARHLPATLVDLALSRNIDAHKILRGTRLFYEDFFNEHLSLSPAQCFALFDNLHKYMPGQDSRFLLGHRLYPGNYGAASTALVSAGNLQDALDIFCEARVLLSPLLCPHLEYGEHDISVYWHYSCSTPEHPEFLVEILFAALGSLCRWLSGTALPWRYYFAYSPPKYIEQYQVNFGEHLHFNAQRNAMVIGREHLHSPWPKASPSTLAMARRAYLRERDALPAQDGFLVQIYQFLHSHISQAPNLEDTAKAFCMSSASLKRKLQKHRSHFQQQYDLVRRDLALQWLRQGGFSSEEIAQQLHFHDAANLRRAFKKWTGLTPSELRAG